MSFGFIITKAMLFELFSQEPEFYALIRNFCLVSLKRAGQRRQIPPGLKQNGADRFQSGTTRPWVDHTIAQESKFECLHWPGGPSRSVASVKLPILAN